MTNVGFCGGSAVRELGPASDMRVFFRCVGLAVSRLPSGGDGGLLTDRLYRRYLRLEELNPATAFIAKVRAVLDDISTKSVDWKAMGWDLSSTRLNLEEPNVSHVVHRYLNGAHDLIGNAASFEKRFQIYRPVMTIISDTPRFMIDSDRPLTEYDTLDGEPIWLR
jgi:hypothetical protein